jgi:hypothetical protein
VSTSRYTVVKLSELNTSVGGFGVGPYKTLADRLESGRLNLGQALRYAADVADILRGLHEDGRMHGSVNTKSVVVGEEGAILLPPNGNVRSNIPATDISAFGAMLYEMVTGIKPSLEMTPQPPPTQMLSGEEGIQAAATRLASKCLCSVSNSPREMQNVLTEILLLSLRAKVYEKKSQPAPSAEPASQVAFAAAGARSVEGSAPPRRMKSSEPVGFSAPPVYGYFATKVPDRSEPAPSGIKCPKCGVPYVYPSRARNWFEHLLATWKSPPMRCHRCLHRFISVLGRFPFEKGSPKSYRNSPV